MLNLAQPQEPLVYICMCVYMNHYYIFTYAILPTRGVETEDRTPKCLDNIFIAILKRVLCIYKYAFWGKIFVYTGET